jgi:hypothetical protein
MTKALWFDSQKTQEIFPSTKFLGQLLASTQRPVQLVLGALSAGMTNLGCEADHTFYRVPRLSMSKTHLYMFICLYFTFK